MQYIEIDKRAESLDALLQNLLRAQSQLALAMNDVEQVKAMRKLTEYILRFLEQRPNEFKYFVSKNNNDRRNEPPDDLQDAD